MKKFALIGDGQIAKYHREAIKHVGGDLAWVVDPKYGSNKTHNGIVCSDDMSKMMNVQNFIDYYIIASPSNFHYQQIRYLLSNLNSTWKEFQIICEKPAFLPWEPIIDSNLVNIVLQLRYLPDLPEKAEAEKVVAHFVRDEAYFKSWKGDPKNTGGLFFSLFIHFVDLAIQLGADFEGSVSMDGEQERYVQYQCGLATRKNHFSASKMQSCYNLLYEDILSGGGIKSKDLFYLSWILARNSELFGYGQSGIGKTIKIGKELL